MFNVQLNSNFFECFQINQFFFKIVSLFPHIPQNLSSSDCKFWASIEIKILSLCFFVESLFIDNLLHVPARKVPIFDKIKSC